MKIMSWKCQGMGNPRTVHTLQTWCWRERPNIVFLMEIIIDAKKLTMVHDKCGLSDGVCFDSKGLSRGIGFWWHDLNVKMISFSTHHVAMKICDENDTPLWAAVGIYGWAEMGEKYETWSIMKSLKQIIIILTLFFRDFNEILSLDENGGRALRKEYHIDAFREVMEVSEWLDLGYSASKFTWKRGDAATIIRERLDQFIGDEFDDKWCDLLPDYKARKFPIYKSDHVPIRLQNERNVTGSKKQRRFHFEALWLSKSECSDVVKMAWEESDADSLITKLGNCARELTVWVNVNFGEIKEKIRVKEKEL